jgi:dolichol-phosphate mannosyltransferase
MTGAQSWQQRAFAWVEWLKTFRYIKFGLVGASGTVVNLVVLRLGHEYLFQSMEGNGGKPYASLALAIAVATLNNFTWNRLWTWSDRVQAGDMDASGSAPSSTVQKLAGQLGKYAMASWFGIALQYGLTLWLAHWLHYMLANVIAIVVASVSNYLANDRWTFRKR